AAHDGSMSSLALARRLLSKIARTSPGGQPPRGNESPHRRRNPMFPKYLVSAAAALALSVAASGCATADSASRPDSNAAIQTGESGVPASVDYTNRKVAPATNDQIDAAEEGNPYSVDYRNHMGPSGENAAAEWEKLESGS